MNKTIREIFTDFTEKRNSLEYSVDQMKSDLEAFIDKIVLYGAGSAGIAFLQYLRDIGIEPRYFVDGDPRKWGCVVEGVKVIGPEKIIGNLSADALVIVTINTDGKKYCKSFTEALRLGGHEGVHKTLESAGCRNVIDYTYFRRCHDLFRGDHYNLPSCSDVQIMLEHKKEISDVYELLADDMSKDVFRKILCFRLLDDSITIPTLSQDNQYFEYDLYKMIGTERFIDCGAYNGITLKTFLKNNHNQLGQYVALEPDEINFSTLQNYVNDLEDSIKNKIKILKCAAHQKKGQKSLYALHGPGSFLTDIGKNIVDTDYIDAILDGSCATMIKMNIEGSEKMALLGAKETIKKFSPVLAIAAYHKTRDLWEVPLLIHSFNQDYKFYLRSYMNHISFLFYAVPKGRGHE